MLEFKICEMVPRKNGSRMAGADQTMAMVDRHCMQTATCKFLLEYFVLLNIT